MKRIALLVIVALSLLGCGCGKSQKVKLIEEYASEPWDVPELEPQYPTNAGSINCSDMFIRFDGLREFTPRYSMVGGSGQYVSPLMTFPRGWDQLVVSWNASKETTISITAVPEGIGIEWGSYFLGEWTAMTKFGSRQGGSGSDSAGNAIVRDDTLVLLRDPVEAAQILVDVGHANCEKFTKPSVKLITLSFVNTQNGKPVEKESSRSVWGKPRLAVPEKAQRTYGKRGIGWCSPSCISMVLGYWANVLRRQELRVDVPAVAAGVKDTKTGSTGNWTFNTAYVGTFSGLKAYVQRLRDLISVEEEIAKGHPVIISVDQNILLYGKPGSKPRGHLIVITGFDEKGDVLANDPWTNPDTKEVQCRYARQRLIDAWWSSHNTTYIIEPDRGPAKSPKQVRLPLSTSVSQGSATIRRK